MTPVTDERLRDTTDEVMLSLLTIQNQVMRDHDKFQVSKGEVETLIVALRKLQLLRAKRREGDEDRRDAGRYRWLKLGNSRSHIMRVQDNRAMEIAVDKCGDDWDELIDKAREEFAALNAADTALSQQREGK